MTRAYLEKVKTQIADEITGLEKQKTALEHTIAENDKFIELLDEGNDPNFESFTPRAVNSRNKEKINELEQQKKALIAEKEQIEKRLVSLITQLEECKEIIHYEYDQERKRAETESHKALSIDRVEELRNVISKLELSLEVIDVDMQRCRLEMSDALKIVKNMLSEADNE